MQMAMQREEEKMQNFVAEGRGGAEKSDAGNGARIEEG